MKNPERIVAAIIIAVGIGYLGSSFSLPNASLGDPLGPKTFPVILGCLMTFLGFTLFVKPEKHAESFTFGKMFITVVLMTVLLGIYGYTLPWVGYPLGTFLFLFVTSRLLKEKSWLLGISLSAGLSLGIYVLFTRVLDIPLPLGVIQSMMNG